VIKVGKCHKKFNSSWSGVVPMRRRAILASVPALLGGCLTANDAADGSTTVTTTRTTTTGTTTSTTTEQPYNLLQPDPTSMAEREVRPQLDARGCTELTDRSTTCPGEDGRLDVSVSPSIADLGDTVAFTVENTADTHFVSNPANWRLRKWDGRRWRRIAPLWTSSALGRIAAGSSRTHELRVDTANFRDLYSYAKGEETVRLYGLGPGVYGFSVDGYFESAPDDELVTAALFGLAGEAPPVEPTGAIGSVERDGSQLVVRAESPESSRAELVLSLVDAEPDARLLPEHVLQARGLRNTLPYAATDGIDAIRCVGERSAVDAVNTYLSAVTPDGTTRYGFRDVTFEFSVEGV
jgi:hypothetical protein